MNGRRSKVIACKALLFSVNAGKEPIGALARTLIPRSRRGSTEHPDAARSFNLSEG
jgi:hypothetical protein